MSDTHEALPLISIPIPKFTTQMPINGVVDATAIKINATSESVLQYTATAYNAITGEALGDTASFVNEDFYVGNTFETGNNTDAIARAKGSALINFHAKYTGDVIVKFVFAPPAIYNPNAG